MAAILSGAWVINDPRWLIQSAKQKQLVDESPFGFQLIGEQNPFKGKALFITQSLKDFCQDKRKPSHQWPKFLQLLWVECSKGHFTTEPKKADFVMIVEGDET